MSVFTEGEIAYLQKQSMGRMATVGPDGQPHIIPVTYFFNTGEDALDIGGMNFASGKKWRDAKRNPKVTFLVDDFLPGSPPKAHAVEIRGEVELYETGGSRINPRFPNFVEPFFRLRPTRIVSWGIESGGEWGTNARSVG